jgi:O-antigen ligase
VVCGAAVAITLSRQGMLLLAFLSFVYYLASLRSMTSLNLTKAIFFLVIISVAGYFIGPYIIEKNDVVSTHGGQRRLQMFREGTAYDVTSDHRYTILQKGLRKFSEKPIIGHGLGYHRSESFGDLMPHNEYLDKALDGGIIMLSLYCALLFSIFIKYWQYGLLQGQVFMIIVACTGFFSSTLAHDSTVVLTMGLLCGALGEIVTRRGPLRAGKKVQLDMNLHYVAR